MGMQLRPPSKVGPIELGAEHSASLKRTVCAKIIAMSVKTAPGAKKKLKAVREIRIERPERAKLFAEESLRRMNDFEKRKDEFIASIRMSKG